MKYARFKSESQSEIKLNQMVVYEACPKCGQMKGNTGMKKHLKTCKGAAGLLSSNKAWTPVSLELPSMLWIPNPGRKQTWLYLAIIYVAWPRAWEFIYLIVYTVWSFTGLLFDVT